MRFLCPRYPHRHRHQNSGTTTPAPTLWHQNSGTKNQGSTPAPVWASIAPTPACRLRHVAPTPARCADSGTHFAIENCHPWVSLVPGFCVAPWPLRRPGGACPCPPPLPSPPQDPPGNDPDDPCNIHEFCRPPKHSHACIRSALRGPRASPGGTRTPFQNQRNRFPEGPISLGMSLRKRSPTHPSEVGQ